MSESTSSTPSPKSECLLITGVSGFIGSEILVRLIKAKRRILVLARSKPDSTKSILAQRMREHGLDPDYEINKIEWKLTPFEDPLRFRNNLASIDVDKYSWRVLHMAAVIKKSGDNNDQDRLNIGVTQDLLNWANKIGAPFYYTSSVVAFGVTQSPDVRDESSLGEWEPFNERMGYYRTKRLSHLHVKEEAKHGGMIFCPSVVHGSLEQLKNSRGHLVALRKGKIPFSPRGGANFVSLDYVATTIVNEMLKPVSSPVEERLIVGMNLKIVDYLNLYLESYREFLKNEEPTPERDAALAKLPQKIKQLPKLAGWASVQLAKMADNFGFKSHTMLNIAQSANFLYFKSSYLEDKSEAKEELIEAIKSSFLPL
ncbi:NAD-dependent epimerase/dehydratase family protein [bacterium]|nr:NAD-dependent epimerase/dehydratase family protein [bacterium]